MRLQNKLRLFAFAALLPILLAAAGCGGSASASSGAHAPLPTPTAVSTPPPANAPILTFSTSANTVAAGQVATLTWASTNATAVTITPSISGDDQTTVALSGSTTVVVNSTTTYTATATGPGGTTSRSVTVAVTPVITFSANPPAIAPGASSTLTWSVTDASSISIDNGVGNSLLATGTATVTPAATTTYTATATGPGGSVTDSVTVTVTPQLTVTLTASPTTIPTGGSSTLTWTSTNAVSITISGISGTQPATGSATVSPASTTTYTATATDAGGKTAASSATVTVTNPNGGLSQIRHIIFMVQENRSFDNYFGKLGAYRASRVSGASPTDVNDLDSLPSSFKGLNTRADAPHPNFVVPPFHQRTLQTENLSPSWDESHYDAHIQGLDYTSITGKKFLMDNFLQTTHSVSPDLYDPDGTRPMGYYDDTDLPYYYELATQFATSDAFHSSLLANTIPNRMYLYAATSIGRIRPDPLGHAPWPARTIFEALQDNHVTWRNYYQDGVLLAQFQGWSRPDIQGPVRKISEYFQILQDPNADNLLPQVIYIEQGTGTDEHPDNDIQKGSALVKQVIDALMNSSAWQSSIFILAYDEGGGLYDHVSPFQVVPPDNIAPQIGSATFNGNFDLSGFRVPLIVISPWVKAHYVSHTNMELTSILKLIETRFNLPALTQRDAAAPDMTEFFDFSSPSWLTPPPLPDQPTECATTPSRCNQQLETYPGLP